jgi:hypothetical protein
VGDIPKYDDLLRRAAELCAQINALSSWSREQLRPHRRLVVSFDVYCILLEYTVYMQHVQGSENHSLEEYIQFDDLLYEAEGFPLDVRIDYFLPPNSVRIE